MQLSAGSSWEWRAPIIGALGPFMSASLLLHPPLTYLSFRAILRFDGNPSLPNHGSRPLILSAFPPARVIDDCFGAKEIIFCGNFCATLGVPLRLGSLVISFALETTIFRWPLAASAINRDALTPPPALRWTKTTESWNSDHLVKMCRVISRRQNQ